ncbi:hypothetical protein [Streptomyces sp. NPDC048142]|uniref:hypothetical protein n=1 Tax=Streptomyces sp. NPDC048142 TaxID=3365501 RepID=UPI00371BBBAF
MSAAVVARRWWKSFIGGRQPRLPRTAERGRDGYSLLLRIWASFIGLDLTPARRGTVPTPKASIVRPQPDALGERSRNGRQGGAVAPGWFALPPLVAVGGLAAAGSDAVVLETSSPDGRARFLVRGRGDLGPGYSLELVLHGVDAAEPVVSTVKYPRADGNEQVLLVPVAQGQVGPPASYVRLPGFAAETAWTACAPAPVTSGAAAWDAATIADSVRAALNEATRDAWRRVGELVGGDLRSVIEGDLS